MRIRPHARTRRHGFAIFVAVVMIGILGMALLALTLLFQTDAQRSMRHGAESQLRQLLIAGGAAAVREVTARDHLLPAGSKPVAVPDAAGEASLTIDYEPKGEAVMQATVTATVDNHRTIQSLTLTRTETGWTLNRIELQRPY